MKNISTAISVSFTILNLLTVFLFFSACGGGGGGGSSQTIVISGTVTYERVPDTEGGLDYTNITEYPVRRCLVKALEGSGNNTLANTYTNNQGVYSMNVPVGKTVKVTVYSVSKEPIIKVQDNFTVVNGDNARYVIQSSSFKTEKGTNVTKNLVASSGYDPVTQSVINDRAAAPFAILDNCLSASDFFLSNKAINFPDLIVNWSERNSTSTIGTSNWDGEALYILGDLNQDTDEYDQHVIVHEWGHYFESQVGRSDSVGGPHTDGDILDPRVAFSEGWGNALSAMVLYPDSVYKDTGGANQSITGIMFDVDENNYEQGNDSNFKIGWFSENSVQAILYDIFDPAENDESESWDGLSSNSGEIYDIFTEDIKSSESFITIFNFLFGYQSRNPSLETEITALLAKHEISPIQDEFGSDETNDGGITGSLPVYKSLIMDTSVELNFQEAFEENQLAATQYIKISGVSGKGQINASGSTTMIIELFYQGISIDGSVGSSSIDIPTFDFKSDKTYILAVVNTGVDATITVSLNPEN